MYHNYYNDQPYPPQPQPQPEPPVLNPVQAIGALCVVGLCTFGLIKLLDKVLPKDEEPQAA